MEGTNLQGSGHTSEHSIPAHEVSRKQKKQMLTTRKTHSFPRVRAWDRKHMQV